MKRSLFALLLPLCISAHAQNTGSNLPLAIEDPRMDAYLHNRKPVNLTIQINNAPDSSRKTSIKCTFVTFGSNFQKTKYYTTDENGYAKITLDQNLPYQQIWLAVGNYLYAGAYVNMGLTITINAAKIKSGDGIYMIGDGVTYSGTDGEFNTVMNKHVLYMQDERNKLGNELRSLAMKKKQYSEAEFLSRNDSIYKAISAIDDEFISQYPDYKWAIQNELLANYYGILCTDYWFDKMPNSLFRKINAFSPYFTSNDGVLFYNYFFDYLIDKKDNPPISIDDELEKNYSSYDNEHKAFLDSLKYYSALPAKENKDALKALLKKRQELFYNEIATINTRNRLHVIDSIYASPKSDILKTFLLKEEKDAFAQTYPYVLSSMHTKWCKNIARVDLANATQIQKQIDSIFAKKTPLKGSDLYLGKPLASLPFGASLYVLDSIKNIDDFILNLKSKFKNKALVIDFWATWCRPHPVWRNYR